MMDIAFYASLNAKTHLRYSSEFNETQQSKFDELGLIPKHKGKENYEDIDIARQRSLYKRAL